MIKQEHGIPFSATKAGTTSATASMTAGTNVLYFVTDIAASSSGTMGTWALIAGTNVIWQGSGTINEEFSEPFSIPNDVSVSLAANGTTATYANIAGFYITIS